MQQSAETDPVCGMKVLPANASATVEHEGKTYYFCHPSCAQKFSKNPASFLSPQTQSLSKIHTHPKGMRFFCPMDPDIIRNHPDRCPKCGMQLEPLGNSHQDLASPSQHKEIYRIVLGVVLWLPLLSSHFLHLHFPGMAWMEGILSTMIVFGLGKPILQSFFFSITSGHWNMFTLVGTGILSAHILSLSSLFNFSTQSYFESSAGLVVLMLIGSFLESRLQRQSSSALGKLLATLPALVRIRTPDGSEHEIPTELAQPGDILVVRPGEQVPLDGIVLEGHSSLNESMITGEPIPRDAEPSSKIIAGTINIQGSLVFKATSTGKDSTIAKILNKVAEAQQSRMPIQKTVDAISAWMIPLVFITALITFLGWYFLNPDHSSILALQNAISVLVIACPCALGLATPMAVAVGVSRAASMGILVSRGEDFQTLEKANILVFDKTGTLTEGKPRIESLHNESNLTEDQFLAVFASLAQASLHPLSRAIYQEASRRNLPLQSPINIKDEPGAGLSGIIAGKQVLLGKLEFIKARFPETLLQASPMEASRIYLALDGKLAGWATLQDRIRTSTPEAVSNLQKDGLRLILLSGDHPETVKQVANSLGILEYQGGVSPTEKSTFVEKLVQSGNIVAMAGDGTNDAPAISQAQIGIAMGSGTDLTRESAGLTLLVGDLRLIQKARTLSIFTIQAIRQNLFLAFAYNLVCIPLAATGYLSPLLAGLTMTFSSLSVISNSLRLLRSRL